MITYVSGNLFESPAQVLVNTVNTVGVMGKGVAKEFKRIYPSMFREYQIQCEAKKFDIGNLFLYKTPHKWILNFPTKRHWRNPSRPCYIDKGLRKLVSIYLDAGIFSLAMPLLGCGNGELDWPIEVRPLVEKHLKNLPIDVFVYIYHPIHKSVPEHREIRATESWLRSKPEHLPFSEVWRDLLRVLDRKTEFNTLAKTNNRFRAFLSRTSSGICVDTGKWRSLIHYSDISDFWQQIRSYGFTSRQIAPSGLSRTSSYLMPIFAELDYVSRASISTSYDRLHNGLKTIGLQYFPQPSLFPPEPHELRLER